MRQMISIWYICLQKINIFAIFQNVLYSSVEDVIPSKTHPNCVYLCS